MIFKTQKKAVYSYGRDEIMFDAICDSSEDVERESKLV